MPEKQPENDPQPQNDPNPPEGAASTEAPPGAGSAPSEPRGLRGAGLRYTAEDGVPDWAVGKTADEILGMTQDLYNAVLTGQSNGAQNQSSSPVNPPQSQTNVNPQQQQWSQAQTQFANGAPNGTPSPPDPQLMYSDPAAYQREYNAWIQSQMQSTVQAASAPFLASQAQMARNASRNDPDYSDVWRDYGHEIDIEMNRVPIAHKASVDAWNMAANLVAGKHRKELAQKAAEEIAANRPQNVTVGGGGSDPIGSDAGTAGMDAIDKLFADDDPAIAKFKALGYDARRLKDHARTHLGYTDMDDYAKTLTTHHIVSNGRPGYARGTPKNAAQARDAAAIGAERVN